MLLLGMIYDLASPLMTEGMKNRDGQDNTVEKIMKKAPLEATLMKLATYIVLYTHCHASRNVLK
jgi:hypothetical protein